MRKSFGQRCTGDKETWPQCQGHSSFCQAGTVHSICSSSFFTQRNRKDKTWEKFCVNWNRFCRQLCYCLSVCQHTTHVTFITAILTATRQLTFLSIQRYETKRHFRLRLTSSHRRYIWRNNNNNNNNTELQFCLLFCLGVKLGLSHWGRNVGWGCLRIGCWGEYLGLRGTRWQGSGEDYMMRNFMICTAT